MGLAKIRSKRVGNFVLPFSPFSFLGTGVHPHPPPTTYWCQTNLKYDFWGLGTTWPHQPPKNAGWLAPWATAKGRTPWDGASPLAQGGPPPVALSTSYRGVNATSFEIFGAQVARNEGIGEKFHHSWSGEHRSLPDQLWWNFSPIPSFLATCAPNISKLVAFTPLYDVLNATGGGPPWASGEAPSQGVRPFAVAQGASHPAFLGGWWGHVVPNPQKSYLRLVWHQYVVGGGCGCTLVPRKKKRRKRGLETLFCCFLRFFFLGTRVHPHPPPTTYWCQTNLKYDFWGLGTTWPHQPPKNAGWLAPWATAKGRTPWDGASPLAQGGPPSGRIEHVV